MVSFTLLVQCVAYIGSTKPGALNWLLVGIVLAAAGCLLVGVVTPVVATVIGLGALTLQLVDTSQTLIDIIVLAAAIALLGPGAFSVDARMFGRREIFIPSSNRSAKPVD